MKAFRRHPLRVTELLQHRYSDGLEFEFSRYVHTPQQLLDKRVTFSVRGADISFAWLRQVFDSLNEGEELAIHSKVRRRGRNYHMPMIDFAAKSWSRELESEIRKYLPRKIVRELLVFSSGRSYHAYSSCLIEPGEWTEFMGRLLLINPPGIADLVDARWVGHRLIGGFASLRWSCNTSLYQKYPELIDETYRMNLVVNEAAQAQTRSAKAIV